MGEIIDFKELLLKGQIALLCTIDGIDFLYFGYADKKLEFWHVAKINVENVKDEKYRYPDFKDFSDVGILIELYNIFDKSSMVFDVYSKRTLKWLVECL